MAKDAPLVTDQPTLEAHCRALRETGAFAFDTEFIRDDTYDAILCLVQITDGREVVLVDPTAGLDLTPFWELVTDPALTTIVHAGKEDFEVCLTATGSPPRNIFDVQIAAGFVGYGYPLNLVRLVDQLAGQRIVKGQTLTDWLRRPLTEQQLQYAVDDVAHLPAVFRRLSDELQRSGRSAWAREEFERFESAEFYRPPVEDRVVRIKGVKRLDGLGLFALGRLLEWRDDWARRTNRPTRAMMRDDVVVELARRRPTRATDLQVLRGFPQARNVKIVREILDVIAEAAKAPRSAWPAVHEEPEQTPMTKATVDLLSAFTRAMCHEAGVSPDLVGGPQRLREMVDHLRDGSDEMPILLSGWRREFVGHDLVDLLEGRKQLHLSGFPGQPKLEVVRRDGVVEEPRARQTASKRAPRARRSRR